jgi:hypothetical protein
MRESPDKRLTEFVSFAKPSAHPFCATEAVTVRITEWSGHTQKCVGTVNVDLGDIGGIKPWELRGEVGLVDLLDWPPFG